MKGIYISDYLSTKRLVNLDMKAMLVLVVAFCYLMQSGGNPTPQEKPTREANSISDTDIVEDRFGIKSILSLIHHNHNLITLLNILSKY